MIFSGGAAVPSVQRTWQEKRDVRNREEEKEKNGERKDYYSKEDDRSV